MVNQWKKKNPEKVKEQKSRWRKKHKEDILKTFDKWKEKNPKYYEKMKIYASTYRGQNEEQVKIRQEAQKQFKESLIKQRGKNCQICNSIPKKLDLHHIEYENKPNKVLLLCRSCHMLLHKNNRDERGEDK
jgi:hypothetical protein